MNLKDILIALHKRNFKQIQNLNEKIDHILQGNGIITANDWIIDAFKSILKKEETKFIVQDDTSDFSSMLADLENDLMWKIDDYGEAAIIDFELDKMQMIFSREALSPEGLGCSSISTRRLD